jgi:hypothetical protein
MEEPTQRRSLNVENIKRALTVSAIAATYTITSMTIGDALDINRNYVLPMKDYVRGTSTADNFAAYDDVDLVTIVNEHNQRETYLHFDNLDDGFVQKVPVNENGYAVPDSFFDRVENYFNRKIEELEQLKTYRKLERLKDKIDLAIDHYTIQFKEWLDKQGDDTNE